MTTHSPDAVALHDSVDVTAVRDDIERIGYGVVPGVVNAAALSGMRDFWLAEFAKPGMKFNMHYTAVEGNIAFIVWSGETADNAYEYATDTFVIDNGKIVGMVPDQISPVNVGVQCIKGLAAWEPTYTDRLTACLVRKDMSDPLTGHVSATKGKFSPDVWREVTYEEASKIAAEKIAAITKKFGGNSVGLYGSGQLTLEGQYLENKFMKGVLGSNTMEANARMCMTSAVTGYIALKILIRLVNSGDFSRFAWYCWAMAGVSAVVWLG